MDIPITLLTPMWTGDANQKSERVRETSIVGNLRWWGEAMIRGMGLYACDPTDPSRRCTYEQRRGLRSICLACQIFGCTGWGKRFGIRCQTDQLNLVPLAFITTLTFNRNWLNRIYGGPTRNISGVRVPLGLAVLGFHQLSSHPHLSNDEIESIMESIIALASSYGGLGAKVQNGFGRFSFQVRDERLEAAKQALKRLHDAGEYRQDTDNSDRWATTNQLFRRTYHIDVTNPLVRHMKQRIYGSLPDDSAYLPCAYELRYKGDWTGGILGLREYLKNNNNLSYHLDDLLGKTRGSERAASRLFVSHLYRDSGTPGNKYILNISGFVIPTINMGMVTSAVEDYVGQLFGDDAQLLTQETSPSVF